MKYTCQQHLISEIDASLYFMQNFDKSLTIPIGNLSCVALKNETNRRMR